MVGERIGSHLYHDAIDRKKAQRKPSCEFEIHPKTRTRVKLSPTSRTAPDRALGRPPPLPNSKFIAGMTIHSLYIYDRRVCFLLSLLSVLIVLDRHCACVYYQDWHRTRRPKLAVEGGIMPAVSQAVSARPAEVNQQSVSVTGSPRNTLSSSSGIVVAGSDSSPSPLLQTPVSSASAAMISGPITSTGLSFDEEAKLVYGVILSLRNMIKKLSGR